MLHVGCHSSVKPASPYENTLALSDTNVNNFYISQTVTQFKDISVKTTNMNLQTGTVLLELHKSVVGL